MTTTCATPWGGFICFFSVNLEKSLNDSNLSVRWGHGASYRGVIDGDFHKAFVGSFARNAKIIFGNKNCERLAPLYHTHCFAGRIFFGERVGQFS